jgi:hypothetical protein
MEALDNLISNFLPPPAPEVDLSSLAEIPQRNGVSAEFLKNFNAVTESYWFYNRTIELRFQPEEHIYYLVGPAEELTPVNGVTDTCHIIDRSPALMPWAVKMMAEKLLRTIPTKVIQKVLSNNQLAAPTEVRVPEISLEDFTKLVLEAKTAHREVLEEAGDIGHMAHTWLEYYIKAVLAKDAVAQQGQLMHMSANEQARNCSYAALGWMKAHNVRWIATERKVYSRKYKYAGTIDGLALVDSCDDPLCKGCRGEIFKDRVSIIDWKSSNYLYIEHLYQTAAYEQAVIEEFCEEPSIVDVLDEAARAIVEAFQTYGPPTDRWVNRLGKDDGEFDPWHLTAEDFREDLEGFLDVLSLTRSKALTEDRMRGQKAQFRIAKKAVKAAAKEKEKAEKKEARAKAREEKRIAREAERAAARMAKAAAKVAARVEKLTGRKAPAINIPTAEEMPLVTFDQAEIELRAAAAEVPVDESAESPDHCQAAPDALPVEVVAPITITLPEES